MKAFCISLPHRTDRQNHIRKMMSSFPCLDVEFVDGVRHENPVIGNNLAHKNAVRLAKERGYPYIVVLEDDCEIIISNDKLDKFLQFITEYIVRHPEIQIVNGCGNLTEFVITDCKNITSDWYLLKSPTMYTAHFIIYNSSSYDVILNAKTDIPTDIITHSCNMVFTYPYIATQMSSYSDIQLSVVEYSNIQKSINFVKTQLNEK